MGLFGSLFGRKPAAKAPSHGLIVHLKMSSVRGTDEECAALFKLEDQVMGAVERAGHEYDGNEIGEGEFVMYMYGRDAELLWKAAGPVIQGSRPRAGSFALKRYGEPGAKEERIELSS